MQFEVRYIFKSGLEVDARDFDRESLTAEQWAVIGDAFGVRLCSDEQIADKSEQLQEDKQCQS